MCSTRIVGNDSQSRSCPQNDGALIATAYYLKVLQLMHRFASLQGLTADAKDWEDLEHIMKDAFNAHFLHIRKVLHLYPVILYIRIVFSTGIIL